MAHRQLAERYAKQLNEAMQRIMELESAVADRDDRLQQTKVTSSSLVQETIGGNAAVQHDLEAARHHIKELQTRVSEQSVELQMSGENATAVNAKLSGEIQKLQEQVDASQASESRFRDEVGRLLVEKEVAGLRNVDLEKEVAQFARESGEKDFALHEYEGRVAALEGEIKQMTKERSSLQSQLSKSKTSQNQLKEKLAAQRRLIPTKKGKQQELAAKEEVAKLTRNLDLEKKRRLEAEVLLGPDGKRCKKCNPIIVELGD